MADMDPYDGDEALGDQPIATLIGGVGDLRGLTLERVTGDKIDVDEAPTSMIRRVARAWATPFDELTCEQVRLLVGQDMGSRQKLTFACRPRRDRSRKGLHRPAWDRAMQHLRLAAAAAALLAVCAAGGVHAQTFTSVEAEARSFHLGAFELGAIRDNALKYKNATVFGKDTDPAEVAKVLAAHGASTDGIPLDVDA